MSTEVNKERAIRAIVGSFVEAYASAFSDRHLAEVDDEDGTINMKIHNVYIAALGCEIQYYSASNYSMKTSLSNAIQDLAKNIAKLNNVYTCGNKKMLIKTYEDISKSDNLNDKISFWNFICKENIGYNIVTDELNKHLPIRL